MLGSSRKMKFAPERMLQEFSKSAVAQGKGAAVAADEARTIVVTLHDDAAPGTKSAQTKLHNLVGLKSFVAAKETVSVEALESKEGLFLPNLGVVIMRGDLDQAQKLAAGAAEESNGVLIVTPERRFSAVDDAKSGQEYLLGYRDGVEQLVDKLLKRGAAAPELAHGEAEVGAAAGQQFTYGVKITGTSTSPFSGDGARIAVLDTGIDFNHPDFQGRVAGHATFVGGTSADVHTHGTHCAGTACGPKQTGAPLAERYGVAYDADLYVGKVLADNGFSVDSSVVLGMDWAIGKQCQVISMSLGSGSSSVYPEYEIYGDRAMSKGCLIVAAAGNNANRPFNLGFVESPANCQTVLAVGGIDRYLNMYAGSGRSVQVSGGYIDVVGPAVDVYSSMSGSYGFKTGTSMATPHVAGIAALWHQKTGQTGVSLALLLHQSAKPLNLPSLDVGKGLAQAPQS